MIRKSVGRKLAAAALFTAALSGCKNGFEIPIWNPFAKPDKGALHTDSDGGQWQDESIQPRESGLTKSFKKLGETVSKPFKKNPESEIATREDDALTPATKNAQLGPGFYVSLARMEAKAGNVETAVQQYQKALDADPDHLEALLGLARLYDRQEEQPKALEYYRRAAQAHPDNGTALNDLGISYSKNGRLDDSIATLQRAVSADPEHKLYRNNLGIVLVEAGRAQEALRTLSPVHGQAVAHYNVGFLLTRSKRHTEALGHFETAVELDPTLTQAKQWVAILRKDAPTETATTRGGARPAAAPASREPSTIAGATEAADIVELDTAPRRASPPAPVAGGPSNTAQTEAVPLDAPITTPYVPQSDIAPKTRPISQSKVVERAEPQPALKPTTRMPPLNPHQPPQVEIPRQTTGGGIPAGSVKQAPTEDLIGPKLMQKRPATGDRYEVAGPARPAPQPTASLQSTLSNRVPTVGRSTSSGGLMPPLPEQVSTLPEEPAPEAPTATPKARTAAGGARYPASRY